MVTVGKENPDLRPCKNSPDPNVGPKMDDDSYILHHTLYEVFENWVEDFLSKDRKKHINDESDD